MRKDVSSPTSPPFLLLQCEQADLHHALIACGRFSKLDPLFVWVLLTAQNTPGAEGWLRLERWSKRAGARIWAEIPACVAFPGRIALPFQPLATLVAQLRPGMVQLAQGQVSDTNALAPFRLDGVPVFTANLVLTLEQVSRSQRGTQSTSRARLRALPPTELGPMPPLAWEPGPPLARVAVTPWCHAVTSCVLLTKECAPPPNTMPDIDYTQVLIRFAPDHWNLLASTRERLVQCALPLLQAQTPAPLASALFPGPTLAWICQSLREVREPGPLTLRVTTEQESGQLELQVQTSLCTFVCRGTSQAIPLVWESPLHWPASVELVVARPALAQALTHLPSGKKAEWDGFGKVEVKERILRIQWMLGEAQQMAGQREIPLLSPTSDMEPVLVQLLQWRQLLALVTENNVTIQFGALQGKATGALGYLRLTDPRHASSFLMTLGIRPATPVAPPPKKEEALV